MFEVFEIAHRRTTGVAPGHLRVLRTDLGPAPGASAHCDYDWLNVEEAARAAAMRSPRRRAQFAAGRWLLHRAARALLPGAPYRIEARDERPVVVMQNGLASPACSIAHCENLVVCALGRVAALGIDVERIRARTHWRELAARVFHPAEHAAGGEDPDWERFYAAWTRKEALAKAIGVGLALPFNRVSFSADGRLATAPPGFGLESGGWRTCALELAGGFAAALAWREA